MPKDINPITPLRWGLFFILTYLVLKNQVKGKNILFYIQTSYIYINLIKSKLKT